MSKYGNANKAQYSKKQLAAIRDFKEKLQTEASDQGYGDEARDILNKVYRSFEPVPVDSVQEAADEYLRTLISKEGDEDFSSDWASDDVNRGLIDAFKAGYRFGQVMSVTN